MQSETNRASGHLRQPKIEEQHRAEISGNEHTQVAHLIESYRSENQSCHTWYNQLLPQISAKRYEGGMATIKRPSTEVGQTGKGFR